MVETSCARDSVGGRFIYSDHGSASLVRRPGAQVPLFLLRVDVPDDVVREPDDLVARSFGHLGETLCLGLVLECVAGEIDSWVGDQHLWLIGRGGR